MGFGRASTKQPFEKKLKHLTVLSQFCAKYFLCLVLRAFSRNMNCNLIRKSNQNTSHLMATQCESVLQSNDGFDCLTCVQYAGCKFQIICYFWHHHFMLGAPVVWSHKLVHWLINQVHLRKNTKKAKYRRKNKYKQIYKYIKSALE